ncbi:MAG: DUF58 domain-containing protein [Lachnospiraceae bacterium]|nr:DUF58 domain-containing protein [Lachnospiraceae bacterium]
MMKYITRIQARVSIHARKKTSSIFDGSYKSIYTGNGLDFENLREYIPGDNVRDIDWKASARNKNLLIKRYVAEKRHNIMLIFDTGAGFLADTNAGETKKDLALNAGGTVAYLSAKNGDSVGAVYNRNGMIQFTPMRAGLGNVERILTDYDKENFEGYKGNLAKSLEYIIKNVTQRMIVFVISDAAGIYHLDETLLKQLSFRHDVLFISIGDASLTGGKSYDMNKNRYVTDYITHNKKLMKLEQEMKQQIADDNEKKLIRYRIVNTEIHNEEEIDDKIVELLERHKYANNR